MKRRVALFSALVLLAVVGFYRVFAPAETVSGVTGPLPAPPTRAPGVVGTLPWLPLFVDGRLRVYADGRQVHADGPIDFRVQTTPYWSYRRWPATVAGLAASGGTVVSHWSDGELVALDATTGAVRWRASGPSGAVPHTAGDLAVTVAPGEVRAYRLADGAPAWWLAVPGCAGLSFTASGGLLGVTCGGETRLIDTAQGTAAVTLPGVGAEPLGCGPAHSGCAGVRIAGRAWVLDGPTPVPSAALAAVGVRLVDGLAVAPAVGVVGSPSGGPVGSPSGGAVGSPSGGAVGSPSGGAVVAPVGGPVVARDARTGAERWRAAVAGSVFATQPGRVHVLTSARDLVTLDAATGAELSRFRFVADDGAVDWELGPSYAADGYVATTRLGEPEYPYPVMLAAT